MRLQRHGRAPLCLDSGVLLKPPADSSAAIPLLPIFQTLAGELLSHQPAPTFSEGGPPTLLAAVARASSYTRS